MKKKFFLTLLLVLTLVFSLGTSAKAAGTTGTITVNNPHVKQSYYVYRIFDLESFDKTNNVYSYTVNSAWQTFVTQPSIQDVYVSLEESGGEYYVKWVPNADPKAFAQLAIDWAKTAPVDPVDGLTPLTADPIVFSGLPLGYYLIDSSVGALCALTTNDSDVTVNEKNELTTIDKTVKENSTNTYGKENSAQIGDRVSFLSKVTLGEGVENLVVHDQMNHYLELQPDSFKITVNSTAVDVANYTILIDGEEKGGVKQWLSDNCTFEISFKNDYIATLTKGTVITIEYDAMLGCDAKEWTSLDNKTWVKFGDDISSTYSITTTSVYYMEVLKTDSSSKVLKGAKFALYDVKDGGEPLKLVVVSEDVDWKSMYRLAMESDDPSAIVTEFQAGFARIYGLDGKDYYLEETKQPVGYNKLSERLKVSMAMGSIKVDDGSDFYTMQGCIGVDATGRGGVQVINKAGILLPSTGGTGTTIFYYVGGGVVLLASVLLLIKMLKERKNKKVD